MNAYHSFALSSTMAADAATGELLRAFHNTDLGGKVSVKIKDTNHKQRRQSRTNT